jgi:hypothetical protein
MENDEQLRRLLCKIMVILMDRFVGGGRMGTNEVQVGLCCLILLSHVPARKIVHKSKDPTLHRYTNVSRDVRFRSIPAMRDCGKHPDGFFADHRIHDVNAGNPQNALIPLRHKKE